MEIKAEGFIHIEFFYSNQCPYCPTVRKILKDLIKSKLGLYVIVEEINVNSIAGTQRMQNYEKIRGVPAIAIEGQLKFMGIPHPSSLYSEVKNLIKQNIKPKSPRPEKFIKPPELPKKSDDEFSLYT